MLKLIPALTLAATLALATFSEAEPLSCPELLPSMAGIMQTMRHSATLSPAEAADLAAVECPLQHPDMAAGLEDSAPDNDTTRTRTPRPQ